MICIDVPLSTSADDLDKVTKIVDILVRHLQNDAASLDSVLNFFELMKMLGAEEADAKVSKTVEDVAAMQVEATVEEADAKGSKSVTCGLRHKKLNSKVQFQEHYAAQHGPGNRKLRKRGGQAGRNDQEGRNAEATQPEVDQRNAFAQEDLVDVQPENCRLAEEIGDSAEDMVGWRQTEPYLMQQPRANNFTHQSIWYQSTWADSWDEWHWSGHQRSSQSYSSQNWPVHRR